MHKNFEKYFSKYPAATNLEPSPEKTFQDAVVIPAFEEFEYLPLTLKSLAANNPSRLSETMILVVINNPPKDRIDHSKFKNNQKTLAALRKSQWASIDKLNLFWIDSSSPGHEIDGGVGMARKIGMDTALRHLKNPDSALLYCLDADSPVESNYLSAVRSSFESQPKAVAGAVEFKHQAAESDEINAAIEEYETYLRHYVENLRIVGSPYAYHSIGSTMICRANAYIRAGGMRVKNGGEDFYFLQALRKTGEIIHIKDTLVKPSSRPSDRVPFGTGPRIRDLITNNKKLFHHPRVFMQIKDLLSIVSSSKLADLELLPKLIEKNSSSDVQKFLASCEFSKTWKKIYRNTPKNEDSLKRAFHTWFDAFRTLKLIHFLENKDPKLRPVSKRSCSE